MGVSERDRKVGGERAKEKVMEMEGRRREIMDLTFPLSFSRVW
mgnify:CR=1 FL=1